MNQPLQPVPEVLLAKLSEWRQNPESPVSCPSCSQKRLLITDCSTRPYAEWYRFSCSGCGMETTLQIPLGPPNPGGQF